MRVAVYDNLGNNAYEQVKAFRRLGVEADVVLDPLDTFVMSDPRWEDLDLELPADELDVAALPAGAHVPAWVRSAPAGRDPRSLPGLAVGALRVPPEVGRALRVAGLRGAQLAAGRSWVLRTLREYDLVYARGVGPAWCALAHVRCIAQTYGGDITITPFLDRPGFEGAEHTPVQSPSGEDRAVARLQRAGLQACERVLLTDPRFGPFAERLGLSERSEFVPFVLDVEKFSPGEDAALRRELLGGDGAGVLVLVPSRQDWRWKGSDRILRGFAAAAGGRPDARLVCAGWGEDLDRSRALAAELGIDERIVLLPNALSKSRLVRHLRAADVVIDQVVLGSYGTSALEAMSCARPLVMYIDPARFEGLFGEPPPVCNAESADDVGRELARLIDDAGLRVAAGEAGRRWVVENHGDGVARRLLELGGVPVPG